MQQMEIDSIRVSLLNYQRVVILRAKESNRCLPIWIGPAEADSIAMRLRNEEVPRPMTHDLVQSILSSLGATVGRVIVSDLSNDTFYAKIIHPEQRLPRSKSTRGPATPSRWPSGPTRPSSPPTRWWRRQAWRWTRRRVNPSLPATPARRPAPWMRAS